MLFAESFFENNGDKTVGSKKAEQIAYYLRDLREQCRGNRELTSDFAFVLFMLIFNIADIIIICTV